ncbi:MAG: O-antigen ligase family protein [Pseudomonadota bacterium]|nr:O-antigen ligase family protein [Pseudomonadota bacterium]
MADTIRLPALRLPALQRPTPVGAAVIAYLAVAAASALLAPSFYWLVLIVGGVADATLLLYRHLTAASAAWLVIAGCTLEMTVADLAGQGAFQSTIAGIKAAGLGLALLCVLRYGPRIDPFNPGLGFLFMGVTGIAHGLHPGLSAADSLRSVVGSAAPYAFSWSRLSRRWAQAVIRAAQIAPLISVAAGAVLAAAGVRPLFVDSGGARLAALGHPAFLAGVALAALYASLIEVYRTGRGRDLALLLASGVILVLTGARAPLLYGTAVVGLTLAMVPSPALARRTRILLLLAGAAALPLLVAAAASLDSLRVFNLLAHDAADLSGRSELWPLFEKAAAGSPWFGWGVGAGNVIVPQDSDIVRFMHTWAAHNEWLRVEVEGGQVGRGVLVALFTVWTIGHTARLVRHERLIMRLVLLAFACHAYTDNVLISTPACVLFAFCSAVFARGRLERDAASRAAR